MPTRQRSAGTPATPLIFREMAGSEIKEDLARNKQFFIAKLRPHPNWGLQFMCSVCQSDLAGIQRRIWNKSTAQERRLIFDPKDIKVFRYMAKSCYHNAFPALGNCPLEFFTLDTDTMFRAVQGTNARIGSIVVPVPRLIDVRPPRPH